ncbi:MAG TPA: ATP-binding protein, partial [Polyangiaceae bacterium]|nr:ATP-binding protein [Polyangiaceae bacterium]
GARARGLSVGTKLAGATIALIIGVSAVIYVQLSAYQRERLLSAKEMAARAVTRLFADSCAAPIVFDDNGAIEAALGRLGRSGDIPFAGVWSGDDAGAVLAKLAVLGSGRDVTPEGVPSELEIRRESDRLVLVAPIRDVEAKRIGVAAITFSLALENRQIAQVQHNTLIASAAIAFGLTVLLLGIARVAIVRPLGKLVRAANALERGRASEVDVHSDDEIGHLAAAFRSMARAIRTREERIERRNEDMRLVLDNVEQGLLTLDAEGRLTRESSRVAREWFGEPTPGLCFWEYIGAVDARAGERFEVGWMQVVDGLIPLDVCLEQLPRRIWSDARAFELLYRPILEQGRFDKLLVVITDISARLERERAALVERETMAVFQHVMSDRSAFDDFFAEAARQVDGIVRSDGANIPKLERLIHTLKGNSSIYGIESVASFCQTLEDELEVASSELLAERRRALAVLWARVARIRSQFSSESGILVELEEHRALVQALQGQAPEELVARLDAWRFEHASRRLALMGKQIQALARRFGKGEVIIQVNANVRVPPRKWTSLWAALAHVVRNTVDHGLELPEERAGAGKRREPSVTLSLLRREQEVWLSIADDGRGIDWPALTERGRALGLPVSTQEELEAVLFAQGVSSRDEVTTMSGRGIGLAVLRETVRALGGSIRVHSEPQQGTTFVLRLPDSMLREDTELPNGASIPPRSIDPATLDGMRARASTASTS